MRSVALAVLFLAATPVDAAAHCYSVWHYPWPQRCAEPARHRTEPVRYTRTLVSREKSAIQLPTDFDIPLPFLAKDDCAGGEADEATRARLMLRAALEEANAH